MSYANVIVFVLLEWSMPVSSDRMYPCAPEQSDTFGFRYNKRNDGKDKYVYSCMQD